MTTLNRLRRPLRRARGPIAAAALAALLAAGCASAATAGPAAAKPGTSASPMASCGSMPGMTMPACPTDSAEAAAEAAASAGGVNPVPTQVLGAADWQGMKITAEAMTAVPFLIYNGTAMQEVKPPKNVSFHLMVLLDDAQTGVVIPYASVWATITEEGSKTPFDESLWPMISRYMGPHYGNNVVLPGSGTYRLSLLISPPVSARHVEYQDVWLTPHRVNFTFRWKQTS
jgi:Fe2+ transport protein